MDQKPVSPVQEYFNNKLNETQVSLNKALEFYQNEKSIEKRAMVDEGINHAKGLFEQKNQNAFSRFKEKVADLNTKDKSGSYDKEFLNRFLDLYKNELESTLENNIKWLDKEIEYYKNLLTK